MSGTIVGHRAAHRPPAGRPLPTRDLLRTALLLATTASGLVAAAIVLGPHSFVAQGRDAAEGWLALHPRWSDLVDRSGGVEALGNVLLLMPFGTFLAMSVRRVLLPPALVLALLCSPAAELAQRSLPGRVPDPADVWRNTLGLVAVFIPVWMARALLDRASRHRLPRTS